MVDTSNRTIDRTTAAAVVREARATVLRNAGVVDPPRSAGDWAFVRFYDALAENLLASGRANVTVTYADLAALASHRGAGKRIRGGSLRKPFHEKQWRGSLLHEPFHVNGLRLSVQLDPSLKKARPLVLRASFFDERGQLSVEGGDAAGSQPILTDVAVAVEGEERRQRQAAVARRLITELQEAGFTKATQLSAWFARRGLNVPPAVFIALALALAFATAAGAGYLVYRYVIISNAFTLSESREIDGELSSPVPENAMLLYLIPIEGGGRFEHWFVPPDEGIARIVLDDLKFSRRLPDTSFTFKWTIRPRDGEEKPLPGTGPQVRFKMRVGERIGVSAAETLVYKALIETSEDQPPQVIRDGKVIGRGSHIVDVGTMRGWRAGLVTVNPIPGYAESRKSPIEAVGVGPRKVRFIVRHGPVRAEDDPQFRLSFGDDSVWSSGDRDWSWRDDGSGDWWDRYITIIDHEYARPGRYDVNFIFRHPNGQRDWTQRSAVGVVFVGVPVPSDPPVEPRAPLGAITIDEGPLPGSAKIGTSLAPVPWNLHGEGVLITKKHRVVAPQLSVVGLDDPYRCAFFAVPELPPDLHRHPENVRMEVTSFGDGFGGVEMKPRVLADDAKTPVFQSAWEYFAAGRYEVTMAIYRAGVEEPIAVVASEIELNPNAPPRVVRDGFAEAAAASQQRD